MEHSKIKFNVAPSQSLNGTIRVPGDKSISHRSIMLGSIAEGITEVSGFLQGEDSLATLNAFREMGVDIEGPTPDGKVIINGVGLNGLQAPSESLYLGNSGTSMRLLSGLLLGQQFNSTLTGDVSLSGRPMKRIITPLEKMGGRIDSTPAGTAPLQIQGGTDLVGINYSLPVASAQVKSAIILAGLYAKGQTQVIEPAPTRDHTERMLKGFGYAVEVDGSTIKINGGGKLSATNIDVPADISSAAFFMVGASIAKNSSVTLQHVGINPTRIGVINILKQMGANISVQNQQEIGGEPVADITIRSAQLKGIVIPEDQVPLAIDEFPAIFVAAACAEGKTVLTGAEELRVKESDRIQAMADGLNIIGAKAQATDDGIVIDGSHAALFTGGTVESHGDHRIAMAFAMAALRSSAEITIQDCANVNTSFPGFAQLAADCGLAVAVNS